MPAGIILPDLDHLVPIITASVIEVANCNRGFGGCCEFMYAPTPKTEPKANPAANDGMEPKIITLLVRMNTHDSMGYNLTCLGISHNPTGSYCCCVEVSKNIGRHSETK